MAFDLSLETAEKYLWTWLDILRLGPPRFSVEQRENPDHYLTPAMFFFDTLIIYGAIVTVEFGTLKTVHLPALTNVKAYLGEDALPYIGRHVVYIFVAIFLQSLSQRLLLWWPLRQSVDMRTLIKANFYGSAILIVIATADILTLSAWVLVLPYTKARGPTLVFWQAITELLLLTGLGGFFSLWMLSAFTRIRIRRFVEAQIIFTLTGSVCGGAIGFFIGGIIGGVRGGLAATPNPQWYHYVFLLMFTTILGGCISGLPLWLYLFILRKRLRWLRAKIKNEEFTYWQPKLAQYPRSY